MLFFVVVVAVDIFPLCILTHKKILSRVSFCIFVFIFSIDNSSSNVLSNFFFSNNKNRDKRICLLVRVVCSQCTPEYRKMEGEQKKIKTQKTQIGSSFQCPLFQMRLNHLFMTIQSGPTL